MCVAIAEALGTAAGEPIDPPPHPASIAAAALQLRTERLKTRLFTYLAPVIRDGLGVRKLFGAPMLSPAGAERLRCERKQRVPCLDAHLRVRTLGGTSKPANGFGRARTKWLEAADWLGALRNLAPPSGEARFVEPIALAADFDEVAVVHQAIEEGGHRRRVAE